MTHRHAQVIWTLLAGLVLAGPVAGEPDRVDSPSQPLLSNEQPQGWSAGVYYAKELRELKQAGEVVELDASRVVAELGYEVAPFLQLAVQAGWTKADLDSLDGENGLTWAAIARFNLAEYVIKESPVVGRKEWLGAAVEMHYRSNESNQGDADLAWNETRVIPSLYYFRNRSGDALVKDYQATGLGLRGGLVFSGIDGELGSVDLEENRNFGFMLGGDVRLHSEWVARIRATIFGSGDSTIEIGTLFLF